MKTHLTLICMAGASLLSWTGAQAADTALPSPEEMWRIIQAQQEQINELKSLVEANQTSLSTAQAELATAKAEAGEAKAEAASTRSELQQAKAQLDATTLAVEEAGQAGFGSWSEDTSLGGYGELHANFPQGGENEIDFHRFVLFFNHDFNDWISLFSEFELEHSIAGEGQNGEVELEQAFIRMDWTDKFSTDAGLFLMPVGLLNEIHEPNTFYGVERNRIESNIIPSTWWEGGVKGSYRFANGISVDGAITSGLDVAASGSSAYRIRSGRQKVSGAVNEEAAFAGRIKYTGIAGLEIGGSVFYQDDLAQTDPAEFSGLLTSLHADYRKGGFGFRALYARWDLSGDVPNDAEDQYGYYIEPSYRWELSEKYGDLGVYARYSDYEYYRGSGQRENEIIEIGLNYWPTENVVFKLDYQDYDNGSNDDGDDISGAFNMGIGYQF
ncbi:hypothetical protein [Coraliomargarita parva]|uniref:hypothetical protein n=1 Tax=Coraliomargarita parva TaxID=3014050 RepID=UPI0022B5BEDB|nr:hypothetical protein [Coraliomargarita parva]